MSAPVFDQFSTLDAKIGEIGGPLPAVVAKTWLPAAERRRIAAYEVRQAYRSNQAWRFITGAVESKGGARSRREYGDPAIYEDRMVAAIRGESQSIVVDGADADVLSGPELPERPKDPVVGPDGKVDALVARVQAGRLKAWVATVERIVAAWERDLERQPAAQALQDQMRAWAESVRLPVHLAESEHDAVGLGDSVVVLWPRKGDWPSVQVNDPAGYFPDIPANGDLVEFPDGVAIAWEYRDFGADGTERIFLRRLTWELMSITELMSVDDGSGRRWVGPDGVPLAEGDALVLPPADTVGPDGIIRRKLPWHGADDAPATVTCVFSDLTWDTKDVGAKASALDRSKAKIVTVDRFDFGIDFLPVVHRSNTPVTGREHYGRSLFDLAVRLFDDLARVDTLSMSAANYLGYPTIALAGATAEGHQVMPGRVFNVGATGKMDVLDLSSGLELLMKMNDRLQDRVGFTLGMPGQMTGRAAGDGSGIRLLLELLPAISVVGAARQVREPKDSLVLKFAQRMAMVSGVLEAGPTLPARILYGNFLPTDVASTTTAVAELLRAHAISTQTGVSMLVAAGLPIDDAQAEVDRIMAENTEAANQVAEALAGVAGAERVVSDRLGVTDDLGAAGAVAPPSPTLPPAGA